MHHQEPEYFETIKEFIQGVGIDVIPKELKGECFLPGLELGPNCIYYDQERLKHPGDLLHEAGHIAVTPAALRTQIGTEQIQKATGGWPNEGDEIATIIWSYAALTYLQIPPEVVFHPQGYRDGSQWIIDQCESGKYIGVPLLDWMGMCDEREFPNMKRWLRE